ncbi:MAG: imidazole glycerol phosphate synthase subunit HisH [Planctomycetaceae bacterium]|nr:imidazole glycerol phosphate synthase subunit HisH [Planctomycetaceae bacterium]
MNTIGIIDYGMGNLRSVQKALEKLHAEVEIVARANDLANCEGVILPGVGAFRDAIAEIRRQGFESAIHDYAASGRPLLGICLGLQLLFSRSEEDGEHEGLGIISGDVVRFQTEPQLKIPHMGWNALKFHQSHPLLAGLNPGDYVYFVHSYFVRPNDQDVIATTTQHGSQEFVSMIIRGNVAATQFHPEKSQRVGLRLLRNFADLVGSPANV